MNIANGFTLQSENPKNISDIDLKKIHEIEQDMWAEGIGEYVKCTCCRIIYSKKDIFGHLSKDIYRETVLKIEQLINIDSIKCKKCNSETNHIWGENYIPEIRKRYNDNNSFLTTFRDINGEIRGFSDAYINDFHTIYKREFEHYYSNIGEENIKKSIKTIIGGEVPNKLLMHSSIGIEVKYSNLILFLDIIKYFYKDIMNKGHKDILGIYEMNIGSVSNAIYSTCGGKVISINDNNLVNINENIINSDIFLFPEIISSFNKQLNIPMKTFIKKNIKQMRNILR